MLKDSEHRLVDWPGRLGIGGENDGVSELFVVKSIGRPALLTARCRDQLDADGFRSSSNPPAPQEGPEKRRGEGDATARGAIEYSLLDQTGDHRLDRVIALPGGLLELFHARTFTRMRDRVEHDALGRRGAQVARLEEAVVETGENLGPQALEVVPRDASSPRPFPDR